MTATNNNTVDGCLPELVAAYFNLTQMAGALGITFRVADYGGLRDEPTVVQLQEWEREAVAAGEKPYRVAPWGTTKHEYGGAFDAEVLEGGGYPDPLEELGKLAPSAGLIWGGTWSPEPDAPHFELEQSLEACRAEWDALHPPGAVNG